MKNDLITLADLLPVTSHADIKTVYEYGESNPLTVIYKGELLHVTDITVTDYGISLSCFSGKIQEIDEFVFMMHTSINPKDYIIYNGSEVQRVLYLNNENT